MKIPYKLLTAGALALALTGRVFAGAPSAEASSACVIPAANYQQIKIPARQADFSEIKAESGEQNQVKTLRTTVKRYIGILPEVEEPEPEPAQEAPTMRYLGRYKITGYDTCAECCGKSDGITASGTQATVGRTCAASKDLPFGTRLYIEGIGERVVEDRGGGVKGDHIDVLCEDHPACYAVTGYYEVYAIEE